MDPAFVLLSVFILLHEMYFLCNKNKTEAITRPGFFFRKIKLFQLFQILSKKYTRTFSL